MECCDASALEFQWLRWRGDGSGPFDRHFDGPRRTSGEPGMTSEGVESSRFVTFVAVLARSSGFGDSALRQAQHRLRKSLRGAWRGSHTFLPDYVEGELWLRKADKQRWWALHLPTAQVDAVTGPSSCGPQPMSHLSPASASRASAAAGPIEPGA